MFKSIPTETAVSLCKQIQADNAKLPFSLGKIQCMICVACTKSDPSKKLFACKEGNRGCNLVNKVYDSK